MAMSILRCNSDDNTIQFSMPVLTYNKLHRGQLRVRSQSQSRIIEHLDKWYYLVPISFLTPATIRYLSESLESKLHEEVVKQLAAIAEIVWDSLNTRAPDEPTRGAIPGKMRRLLRLWARKQKNNMIGDLDRAFKMIKPKKPKNFKNWEQFLLKVHEHLKDDVTDYVLHQNNNAHMKAMEVAELKHFLHITGADEGVPTTETTEETIDEEIFQFDVYISYNYELEFDSSVADEISKFLKSYGLNIREKINTLGGNSLETYTKEIRKCRRLLPLITKKFLELESLTVAERDEQYECYFHIQYAQRLTEEENKRKIIPVIIEECELPDTLFHLAPCKWYEMPRWTKSRLLTSILKEKAAAEKKRQELKRRRGSDSSFEVISSIESNPE